MATCQIFRDKSTGEVSKVTAPNGQESQLFASLSQVFPDKEEALENWALAYTDQFKDWFGDWEMVSNAVKNDPGIDEVTLASMQEEVSKGVDDNGEPTMESMHKFMAQPMQDPLPLKGHEDLYKKYNLLNKYGKIKTLKYNTPEERKKMNEWVATNNQSPFYRFEIRLTPVGHKMFIFPRTKRGGMDTEIGNKYFPNGNTTTAVDILQKIASSPHVLNRLAKQLMSYAEANNVEITLVPNTDERLPKVGNNAAAGVYFPSGNNILINKDSYFRGAGSEPTILHEILHALTVRKLEDMGDPQVKDLTNLYHYAVEKLGEFNSETGEGEYALSNPDEFIVALFTDGKFINKLLQLPAKPGEKEYNNLFEQLLDYILGLFKITEKDSFYGQAYAVATHLLETAKADNVRREESYQQFLKEQPNYDFKESMDELPDDFFAAPQATEQELQQQVLNFLAQIGVSVETVNSITDAQGNPITAQAKADMLNRIIQVMEGTMDSRLLGEEAAHFFVNMLGDGHPLMQQMMSQITSYQIYRQVVEDYKDLPEYRNPDGTINFNKLKKEAIGQLISEYILKNNTADESQEKVARAASWWRKVWNYITDVFSKREDNPFAAAASQILNADTSNLGEINAEEGVYFSYQNSIKQLREEQNQLILDNSIDKATGQKRHIYKRNGRPVRTSVTTLKVDAYYKRIFPNDRRSERQKELDLLKAEYGDAIHEIMEAVYDAYIDADTGLVRDIAQKINHPAAGTEVVTALDKYFTQMLSAYPPGTTFMKEVKIYDPVLDMAGSIDLLAILPDGTVDIYDWKSQEIAKFQTEIKDFKPEAYRIQLGEYKRILREFYGFTKFGTIRAIPIKTSYNYIKDKKTDETIDLELRGIEIGDFDPVNIPDDKAYLLPISMDETTGDKKLDKLIKQLNGIYKRIEQRKYRAAEKYKQKEELKRYKQAIRDLELKGSIDKFIELGKTETARILELLATGEMTSSDAINALDTLKVFSSTSGIINSIITDYMTEVRKQNNPDLEVELEGLANLYKQMTADAAAAMERVEEEVNEIAKGIALRMGIIDFDKAEKGVGRLEGLFNSLSQLDTRALKTFYGMVRGVQNTRDAKFSAMMQQMQILKRDMEEWGKKKGLSGDKLFDIMLDFKGGKWTGNFLKKYDSEFYKKRDEAIRSGDWKWIAENTEFDGERFKKEKESKLKYYKEAKFMTDEEANAEAVAKAYYRWLDSHNILDEEGKPNPDGYLNPKNNFLKPAAKWQSAAWKELNAKGNEPALAVYKQFQKMIRESEHLGMLDEYSPEFVPSMFKSKLDHFVFGGMNKDMFAGGNFFEELMVDGNNQYFPDLDPVTGEVLNRVPVYFTRDMGVDKDGELQPSYDNKSKDLFKVFSIWGAHTYSYEAMSALEDDAHVLSMAERNKESLVTNLFGEAKRQANGQMDTKPGNERNAQLLEDFVNFYIYNRRSGEQYDFKIKLFGKTFSAVRTLQYLLGFFSLKTLALNPLSGTAQFVGGTANAFLLGSKKVLMNNNDWVNSMYLLTKRDPKAVAMLDHFDLLLEDHKRTGARELSVSKIVANFSWDKAYFIQRWADSGVQKPLGLAMMQNYMLDPNTGLVVNITNFVKDEMGYNTKFYNLPKAERDAFTKEMEEKIGKLKKEQSLYATAKIENDRLVVPGLDVNATDPAVKAAALKNTETFRAAVKKANKIVLGNSTQDDINSIRTHAYGMVLMQFRSWIPTMAKERFGGLYKDADLEVYQYGKLRSFFGELFSVRGAELLKDIVMGFGNDGAINAAKARYQIEKAAAYERGDDFDITEAEFIDMHIANLRSSIREIMIMAAFWMMLVALKPGDDDDDDEQMKGVRKYTSRAVAKYFNEFAFYYNPIEFTNLIKTPFPIISLAEDFFRFIGASGKQGYGFLAGDGDMMDGAKPLKYLYRMLPIAKEAVQITAIFDDDFRKEWDIRIQ